MTSHIENIDCMEFMRQFPDKHFDLAVVDPPYGLGFSSYERVGSGIKTQKRYTKNEKKTWDNGIPDKEYFDELFRISKNQIIWGGNYFELPPSQSFIFWHKQNPVENFADGELAWTSHKKPAKCFKYRYYGNLSGNSSNKEQKFHPTQKPIELYDWIFSNYAEHGMKIIDTHLGSGSSRISADKCGMNFWGCELDTEYFKAHQKRWDNYKSQLTIF